MRVVATSKSQLSRAFGSQRRNYALQLWEPITVTCIQLEETQKRGIHILARAASRKITSLFKLAKKGRLILLQSFYKKN